MQSRENVLSKMYPLSDGRVPRGMLDVSYSQYMVSNEHLDLTHDMFCAIFQLKALGETRVFELSCGFTGNKLAADLGEGGVSPQERSCARSGMEIAGHLPCPDLQATCRCQAVRHGCNSSEICPTSSTFHGEYRNV